MPKRRRLAILFLLGVGIPSLALSLLAFRGIQNELALLRQRQFDEYRALADLISDSLLRQVGEVETSLSRIVTVGGGEPSPALTRALDSLKADHPIIEVAFFLEEDGRIQLPTGDLLFRADDETEIPEPSPWPPQAGEEMRNGQEQEFRQDRLAAAYASYRRAFESVSDSVLRGQALLAMTRVQRKAGQTDGALATCETLVRDYGGVRTGEGMPLGPIALLERGSMRLAAGDSLAALTSLTDLYGRLVAGEWELGKAQYEFLAGQAVASIQALTRALGGPVGDSVGRAFAASRREEVARRERAERILFFQGTAGEDLLGRLGAGSPGPEGPPRRFSLESGGQTYLVSLLDGSLSDSGVWGFLLDSPYLTDAFLLPTLQTRVDTATTEWIVRGRDGRTILAGSDPPSGSLVLNAPIAGSFPPWLIEFYQRPRSTLQLLLTSGQSIYFYMFLAIATILGFGLVLTIRAISQELELARLKSDFVSTVSHEFKSPLTSIRQLSEMLQSGRVPSEERRQRYYDVLVEQSSRLSSLVTNVLDLARIDEGRKEFRSEPVNLVPLIRELADTTQHRVGHEGFEVRTEIREPLPEVRGDTEALRQALSNLLNNAIQYSGEAREVDVVAESEGRQVTIAVKDAGVGIPEDEISKVFDRFYRGGNEVTRAIRGSGLGLTLVREIVDAHGGSVEVASEIGKGSTFTIRLPAMTESDHG